MISKALPRIAVAALAVVSLAGTLALGPGKKGEGPRYRIDASAIHKDPSGLISGTITLKKDPHGDPGMTGGGCLVYEPADGPLAKTCGETPDCNGGATPAGYFGYCADASQPGSKKCWYKPSDCWCFKSPHDNLPVGTPISLPHIDPSAAPANARWRIITCQNITPLGCGGGVEGQNKRTRYGPISAPGL